MARHTKLTPELHEKIVVHIAHGVPPESAALMHDVDAKTFNRWLALGTGKDRARPSMRLYAALAEDVQKALAKDEATRILRIASVAQGGQLIYERTTTAPDGRVTTERRYAAAQWTADMTHLERTRPATWSKKTEVEMRVKYEETAAKIAAETGLSVAEIMAEAERLLKA